MTATHPWHLGRRATSPSHCPEQVGWTYCGLRSSSLAAGVERSSWPPAAASWPSCPSPGRRSTSTSRGERFDLDGAVVGVRPCHRLVLPADRRRGAPVVSRGRRGAGARVGPRRSDASTRRYVAGRRRAVELRGAGPATRQVNNFMSPEAFDGSRQADRASRCSRPTATGRATRRTSTTTRRECPANNEEIYYFRVGRAGRQRLRGRGLRACTAPTRADGDDRR